MNRAGYESLLDENGINLSHLQVKLTRIDLLVQRAVRLWQAAGQNPEDNFRGLTISIEEAQAIAGQPFGTNWGQIADLSPEEEEIFDQAFRLSEKSLSEIVEFANEKGYTLRLDQLQKDFQLEPFDLDTLLICLAPALDLRYERLYGFLQDDVTCTHPTVNLVLNLLGGSGVNRLELLAHFSSDSPLLHAGLVGWEAGADGENENLLGRGLQIDPTVVAWLLGKHQPGPDLEGNVRLLPPQDSESDRLLANPLNSQINLENLATANASRPILVFHGLDQASQKAAARQCAAFLDRQLLQIDMPGLGASGNPLKPMIRRVLRDARLSGAVPFFTGWDAVLIPSRSTPGSPQGEGIDPSGQFSAPAWLMEELFAYRDLVIITGRSFWQISGFENYQDVYWLSFPLPDFRQRQEIWKHFLGPSFQDEAKTKYDLAALAGQFALTGEQIRDAISWARSKTAQFNSPLNSKDLFLAARLHSNSSLGNMAHKIDPRYTWTCCVKLWLPFAADRWCLRAGRLAVN